MKSPNLELTVVCQRDTDGWWVAQIPQIPGAVSQGRTRREAKDAAMVALALTLHAVPQPLRLAA